MRELAALGLATLLLTGCSVATSDPGGTCPTVVEYPPEVQAKAAAELSAMKPGIVRDIFIPDYGTMRDEARACRGEEPTS